MLISLIIPIYNEEKIIDKLYTVCIESLEAITDDFEIICVNDGSKDKSLSIMKEYHKKDKRFKVLNLSRNFGHQAAYTAGLTYSKGKYIAMMDGDLQDPPHLIKEMYNKMIADDLDVVYGSRKDRKEGFVKKFLIKKFHLIFNKISNINAPENVGNFSLMNRKALDAFLVLNEKNRYLPGLRFFIGFNQGFVEYTRPDRTIGDAKMNYSKLFKLAMDALFSFSKLPIRLCFFIGLLGVIFTFIAIIIVLVKKFIGDAYIGWTSTLLSIYFLGSVQLLFMGIIGEYIHRIFIETQNRPIYIVKDYFDNE